MIRIALIIALGGLLIGCAGNTERLRAINAQQDDAKCQSYGAAKGSYAYVSCRTALERNRTAQEAIAWDYLNHNR
jgi:hypothetical protein